ncbi:hypothetical protein ACIQMJ_09820 [Actinosynnema sp. NPDC091369]
MSATSTPHRTSIPDMGDGLGVFVQDTGQGTVITHNGGAAGHAALMYSTPDGRKTLAATLDYVDDAALSLAVPFQAGDAEARGRGVPRRSGAAGRGRRRDPRSGLRRVRAVRRP